MKDNKDIQVKITRLGELKIKRNNQLKAQYCSFSRHRNCGDSCPLFEEPVIRNGNVSLTICKRSIVVAEDKFSDERQ